MWTRALAAAVLLLITVALALAAWLIPSPTLSMLPTTLAMFTATAAMIVGFLAAVEITTTLLERLTPTDAGKPTQSPATHPGHDAPPTPRRAA